MTKILTGLTIGIGAIVLVAVLAIMGGTIVYWIWPVAIPAVFPTLLGGAIAAKLTWWQAVAITWLMGLLVKSTNSTTTNTS